MDTFNLPMPFLVLQVMVIGGIVYSIKAVVDARVRTKLIASNLTDTLIHALLVDERKRRRHASLRWGIILSFLAGGFGLSEVFGWRDATPGAIGLLLGATGIGNLVFYAIERRVPLDERGGNLPAKST